MELNLKSWIRNPASGYSQRPQDDLLDQAAELLDEAEKLSRKLDSPFVKEAGLESISYAEEFLAIFRDKQLRANKLLALAKFESGRLGDVQSERWTQLSKRAKALINVIKGK